MGLLRLTMIAALLLPVPAHAQGPAQAEVSACFSPGPVRCSDMIADAIDGAKATVRVQAYWFTSVPILRALAAARRRGLDVQAILDKSQDRREGTRGRYSAAVYLVHAGVPVWMGSEAQRNGKPM